MATEIIKTPYIDPDVKYWDVSRLRDFNAQKLTEITDTVVVQDAERPLVVIVPYAIYMELQRLPNEIMEVWPRLDSPE